MQPVEEKDRAWMSGENYMSVTKLVKSYNTKAAAAGLEPAVMDNIVKRLAKLIYQGETLEDAQTQGRVFAMDITKETPPGFKEFEGLVTQYSFDLKYPKITLDSWEVIARIKTEAAGNLIVSKVPHSEIPEHFKTRGEHCDHCNTARNRRFTYLLRNPLKEMKQVGNTCLRDFTGDRYAVEKAKMIELGHDLSTKIEAFPAFVISALRVKPLVVDVENYLTHVACAVRENGFVARKDTLADCTLIATSDFAWLAFEAHCQHGKDHAYNSPTDEDLQLVRKAISWANGLSKDQLSASSYLQNIAAVAARPDMLRHQAGLAASIIPMYLRDEKKKRDDAKPITSKHVGVLGERSEFANLTCTKVIEQHHERGVTHLHKFVDPLENVISWFSSNTRLKEGSTYNLMATVKKHDVFKGVAQTTITRAKVIPTSV